MPDRSHSPEPWKVVKKQTSDYFTFLGINDATGQKVLGEITGVYESESPEVSDADVNRIVACVNALSGWDTHELINRRFLKTGLLADNGRPIAHLADVVFVKQGRQSHDDP